MNDLKPELERLINKGIADKLFPACSIGVVSPTNRLVVAGGTFTYEDTRTISSESVFDVASLTKVLPTSCSALKLVEQGRLGLDDYVKVYIPEYKHSSTIWNLLTQTVYYKFGFPLSSLGDKSPKEILRVIFDTPIEISDSKVNYTNSSSILLGLVVEKIYKKSLDAVGSELFFQPLGMSRTGFKPMAFARRDDIVPTEYDGQGLIHGVVHDESTRAFVEKPLGSAGLFSTAPDLLRFIEMIVAGGSLDGVTYFTKETIKKMGQNQLKKDVSTGLGWELDQPRYMGKYSRNTFGKTGFTGCLMLCNPGLRTGLVILSNHVHPKRPVSFELINQFRRDVADIVFGSVS